MLQRAMMGAQNNADWYAMMWDVHGLRYVRDADGFRAIDPPPPYHGWVTSVPGAPLQDMIRPVLNEPGFAVKDGTGQHDLTHLGLEKMFDAEWLWHPPEEHAQPVNWVQITDPDALVRWEAAWRESSPSDQRQFPDEILRRSDVRIWGRLRGDRFDAGGIANLSEACVGLSNCFGADMRRDLTALCAVFGQGRCLVGYESGDELKAALDAGWTSVGKLSVWQNQR